MLDEALEASPADWPALVDRLCAGDAELRREVESLLTRHEEVRHFLESPAAELVADAGSPGGDAGRDGPALEGRRVGPYRLLREIGRGGMGRVFLAERADGQFQQRVALKLVRSGFETEDARRRFLFERQILASLDHPNIARLLDGGVTEQGEPYLAMEYVAGRSLHEHCDAHRLPVRARLELFLVISEAVEYAHRKLVVHRDLKPGNILVATNGQVKLLDFGIAKLLAGDEAPFTVPTTRVGRHWMTPEYAAPEQIRGEAVTTATDVYQLGVLLYELLVGRRPFERVGGGSRQVERAVLEREPEKPSTAVTAPREHATGEPATAPEAAAGGPEAVSRARSTRPERLRRALRGDLDSIVLKALRKEPELRYPSATALRDDLRRHLAGLPVEARRGTRIYRTRTFVRRHRWGLASAAAFLLLLTGYAVTASVQARNVGLALEQARVEAANAERARTRAEALHEFLRDLFRAAQPDRPRDQLPDTEAVLELGARRALDEHSAPPAERLGMLLTIGHVYVEQNRFEQARPLIDAAVALAREHRVERPEDLARALMGRAYLAWQGGGSLEEAEALLLEAESIAEASDAPWDLLADVRADRGGVEYLKGNREQALGLLEPLYRQMQQREDVNPHTRFKVVARLANTHQRLGNLEAAADLHREGNELARRLYGSESLTYAIHLANSANVERELGRYDVADSRNLQAIDLYDQIYDDTPMGFRAVARRNRVRTLLALGRFDDALTELAASTDELARAAGVSEDDDPSAFFYRGKMLALMHRWRQAERELTHARSLYAAAPEPPVRSLINVEALLAWTYCRQGETDGGEALLAALDSRLQGRLPDDTRERAQIHDARATCHLRAGRLEPALHQIDLALAAVSSPGRVMDRADRMILRARILAALGRIPEAERELDRAESLYRARGLLDHPMYPDIDTARRALQIDSAHDEGPSPPRPSR